MDYTRIRNNCKSEVKMMKTLPHFFFFLKPVPQNFLRQFCLPFPSLWSVKPPGFSIVALLQQRIDIWLISYFLFSSEAIKEKRLGRLFWNKVEEKGLAWSLVSKKNIRCFFLLIIAYLYRKYSDLLQKKTPHSYKYIEPHYDYK